MGSITVTATDPSDMSTTTQTFQVTVGQNTGSTGQVLNERPFISPQLSNMTSATNQPAIFQIPFVNAEPTDTVSFTVRGGITTNPTTGNREFTNIQNATATVDANGIVRITPNNNFTGTINFVVGVRDQVQRGPTADSPDNFDTQTLTLTVRAGEQVNFAPVASPSTASIPFNTPTSVQLVGQTANPNSATQTLVFEIVSPPTQGTITDFNANTGQFTYTPPAGVVGTATLQFRVRDVGAPLPNLVSAPATVTFNIVGAMTGSVRVISNVLVVSAPPRTDGGRNTINVAESNGQIVVFVNGFLDETQPDVQDLDRIVIYGSKASDVLRVDPSVTLPTTINGGTGGKNVLLAGNGPSRLHGWFGKNRLRGGAVRDALLGRTRHVRFVESEGSDQLFAGNGRPGRDHGNLAPPSAAPRVRTRPPIGQFFRFVKGRLVPIPTPRPSLIQAQHPVGRNPNQ
jgi:hypothetical protein